jgi:hypothetical protein
MSNFLAETRETLNNLQRRERKSMVEDLNVTNELDRLLDIVKDDHNEQRQQKDVPSFKKKSSVQEISQVPPTKSKEVKPVQ